MLDFIYYPVSWILWFWHKVFGAIPFLGPSSGIAWALSVVFLVFTLRLVLYKPFVKQVRTTRQMQELQPQIKALQKKYGKDKQRMATEMQKLQKEHGFNPIMGCLPVLAQAPVFIGLYHVLRSFNRTSHGFGQLGLDPAVNRTIPNYGFSVQDVNSFLDARLFGAPISAAITTTTDQMHAFENATLGLGIPSKVNLALVAAPLMIIASIATHFNSRASVARQTEAAAAQPQAAIMNKLALYVFPLGVLVGGPFLPIAILLYWVANNIWTYAQQHLVFGKIDKEEQAKKAEAIERRATNAPKPGAKPQAKAAGKAALTDDVSDSAVESESDGVEVESLATPPSKPRPGAKAANRPGQKKPSGQRKSGGNANRGRANQKKRR
ncbi:membrane protein insertase YidC [Antrihabitans cavernicola]|uniref:Membrane protein insertase YidC n=1 Tax=Antrihabitans cavernicola TaxID=2495913 RepID=A0A5A7SIE6_9NOCA|nr:membrane protein insertase YidC [Spelaeibacter cavernicola]KAA0024962.1 membrane protein insertase YidC [Spelaeibacter cavernicola]